MGFLLHPLCKLAVGVPCSCLAYGRSPRLLRVSLVFFGVSAAFPGERRVPPSRCWAGGAPTLKNRIFTPGWTCGSSLLSAAGCYTL